MKQFKETITKMDLVNKQVKGTFTKKDVFPKKSIKATEVFFECFLEIDYVGKVV